ncbi:uncharacterized protein A4U43_C08F35970 [Asparagus officinalis]|uniref:uncharacterized protein LOC109820110 n=1 Tax=Asparagus officinalis TaxID=4686 RepID=UPI00098E7905|nr:uncharacterized protein LOC109820110 [Asparagus officinalis]ONK62020.1 uncharacterized protein A4U43_C08F35970 [Asparagus officinalis]
MEDNKKAAKAFVDSYFPVKQQPNSKFPDVLSDLFPPNSHPDSSKRQGCEGQSWKAPADGYSQGKSSKSHTTSQRSGNAVVFCEVSEPCSMSSSVDYGCRDDYYPNPSTNRQAGSYDKLDKKDGYYYPDPKHSRGEWWQGSLYY